MLRYIECVGLALFHIGLLIAGFHLFRSHEAISVPSLCFSMFIGIFFADLGSGLIHWVCDSIGSSQTPIWGPAIVKPFRDHHRDPLRITQISLVENLGASALAGCVAMALSVPVLVGEFGTLSAVAWISFLAFIVWSNLFHRWSHIPLSRRPRWMKSLQRAKLILDPKEHLLHHARPFRVNYCILNGWANAFTNRAPWERLEGWVSRLGISIHRD